MDPNNYQPGLLDSSSAGGLWQGAPLPVSQHPPQMQHGPGHMLHPPQPPNIPPFPHSHPHSHHHHLGVNLPRMMMMPPRELHFPYVVQSIFEFISFDNNKFLCLDLHIYVNTGQ